jgi:alanyl-tRNA synthetase
MTQRLYYLDAYRTTFDATVIDSGAHDRGHAVVLDQTAFYPTSGGQPFDMGSLGDATIIEVLDTDDRGIVHVVDRPLLIGAAVKGQIDWRRRFDHMQQHTGQHVLSAAYDRLFGIRTESFHLGAESSTIDLAREVSPDQIRAADDEANRIVWEDRSVNVKVVSGEAAKALPLRKESLRSGPLRLIEVEDFDLSACGGTHVARTGAIGIIATAASEKFRGGSRVEFLCGGRALARFRQWRDALSATTRHLSVQPSELAAAVEKLQAEGKALQKTIRAQQEQLALHEARALVARAELTNDARLVLVEALDGWDAAGLKSLAAAATSIEPRLAVALFSTSQPSVAVVSAGTAANVDASAVLKSLIASGGGKGGGKRELAQGVLNAPVAELLTAARSALSD